MSSGWSISLKDDIMFRSNELKIKKKIYIDVSEAMKSMLLEVKGDDTWLSLLVDGAKYRGFDIEYHPNRRYKTHYYCSQCERWVPHKEAIYKVARAYARCPKCMRPLKTGSIKTNKKNWTEWEEEE